MLRGLFVLYDIKKCCDVSEEEIFNGFTKGFADYIIQGNMTQEQFFNRFFGPEGNDKRLSFIALKDDVPVGIILGGNRLVDGLNTLRCGAMAIVPEERGNGLAKLLFDLHEKTAREIGCKQIFLEVIDFNDRAINFYKKVGYEKVYDLSYMDWHIDLDKIKDQHNKSMDTKVVKVNYEDMMKLKKDEQSHLPWQSDFPYFKDMPCNYYCIYDKYRPIAGLVGAQDKVYYLWVNPSYRMQGCAKAMLDRLIIDTDAAVLRFVYANNGTMHTFAKNLNMKRSKINQIEMYKFL